MVQALLERIPVLRLAISATTRARRPNEREGREYYFVSDERFQQLVDENAFIEHVTHPWGPRHGTLKSEIERITGLGRPVLLELETGGAIAVRDRIPGSVTIFITAPSSESSVPERWPHGKRKYSRKSPCASRSSNSSSEMKW